LWLVPTFLHWLFFHLLLFFPICYTLSVLFILVCSCFICFNNPYFPPSSVVNLLLKIEFLDPNYPYSYSQLPLLETSQQFYYFPTPPLLTSL
jgi:hypothetical protein